MIAYHRKQPTDNVRFWRSRGRVYACDRRTPRTGENFRLNKYSDAAPDQWLLLYGCYRRPAGVLTRAVAALKLSQCYF